MNLINSKLKDLKESKIEERNMSYVRFENTYRDLQDCEMHINDSDLSKSELNYRNKMVELCQTIVDEADTELESEDNDEDDDD
jgi:hypothetical protein